MGNKIEPREHETTAVLKRDLMDVCPEGGDEVRWKEFRDNYNKAKDLIKYKSPLQIDFELNSKCNLKCPFCTHGYQKVADVRIGFENYKRVILEVERMGVCSVKLNYINEPLLVKDLEDYVRFAKEHGVINIFFATNGTLLTKERSERLIKSGVTKLFISIDAFSEETYLRMRKSKGYGKVIRNINSFLEVREEMGVKYPLIRVNFLKSKENVHELDDFVKYWSDRVDMVAVQDMIELPNSQNKKEIVGLEKRKEFSCSFPFKQLVIDANRKILPCCTFHGRKMEVGSIDDMTLEEAWNSDKMEELREIHRKGEYWKNEHCKICVNSEDYGL